MHHKGAETLMGYYPTTLAPTNVSSREIVATMPQVRFHSKCAILTKAREISDKDLMDEGRGGQDKAPFIA